MDSSRHSPIAGDAAVVEAFADDTGAWILARDATFEVLGVEHRRNRAVRFFGVDGEPSVADYRRG